MKRNFVQYEVFEKIKETSLNASVHELIECQEHLSRVLNLSLTLESFDNDSVIFRNEDGTYLKANYSISDDALTFDNLEEWVIDEASEVSKRKEVLAKMLESIYEDKIPEANVLFDRYMKMASEKYQREGALTPGEEEMDESYVRLYGTRGKNGPKVSVRHGSKDPKRIAAAKKAHRLHAASYKVGGRKRHSHLPTERSRRHRYSHAYGRLHAISGGKQYKKRHLNDWLTLSQHVLEYVDLVENGHVLSDSVVRRDEKGEVLSVRIPTSKVRNEGKVLKMHYEKMLKFDSPKIMREAALKLSQDINFARLVADLKRNNNLSDNEAMEESLSQLVTAYPAVLYLTQEELATAIGQSLKQLGETNFVDDTCNFLADAVSRTAFEYYDERVDKILKFAKSEIKEGAEDKYAEFQKVVASYFPTLDETIKVEMRVFEDLHNAVLEVRRLAIESQNEDVKQDATNILSELETILSGKASTDLELIRECCEWLEMIFEANNIPGSGEWNVEKNVHHTISGDHPQMAKNARVPGTPDSVNDGDMLAWQLDDQGKGKSGGEFGRMKAWGNKGGKEVWPDLSNPVHPKQPEYTMGSGDKGADKEVESGLGTWQDSSNTFPALRNPYVEKPADIYHQNVDTSQKGKLD